MMKPMLLFSNTILEMIYYEKHQQHNYNCNIFASNILFPYFTKVGKSE